MTCRRRGYAETAMRHSLEEMSPATGLKRTPLPAEFMRPILGLAASRASIGMHRAHLQRKSFLPP
jgi:hypothetical protein